MTMQEAYDRMRAFYSREDTFLARYAGACEYIQNGNETTRCAVGCLLPMELLEESGETLNSIGGIANVKWRFEEGNPAATQAFEALGLTDGETFDHELFQFLQGAQNIHDDAETKAHVIEELDDLALAHGLVVGGQL